MGIQLSVIRQGLEFRHKSTPIIGKRAVEDGWIVLCAPSQYYPKWSTHFACMCADGKLGLFFTELHEDAATAVNRYAERT